ncbi:MAG: hypothetical protein PUE75_03355 [Eubacteriales bacterium]|nr:hypothetical protein [Eubacteriales bacterium]
MDNNINDIISSLTDDDINMLKSVASSILGGENQQSNENTANLNKNQGSTQKVSQSNNGNNNALPANLGFDNIDFDMIMKAKKIFDTMNNTKDKNVDLILALKPHLRPETQNKADQAMKILKLFDILPLLRELF